MIHRPRHTPFPTATRAGAAIRAIGVVVLALVLLVVGGGVASAAHRVFTDPNDSPTIDIRKVHVSYGDWLRVRVEHDGGIEAGQLYAFWIDTRRRNPGPEYYAAFRPNAEVPPLERVAGFGDRTKTPTGCQKIDAGANAGRPHGDVTFRVAGACLGNPHRVRISVHFLNPNGSSADWAPAARRLYPGVHRH